MILEILRKGKIFEVLIDDEDYELIKCYGWNIAERENTNYAYAYIKGTAKKRKRIKMHRLIMNAPDGVEVDHENRNGLDNRKSKLRLITRNGNARNCVRKNKSGVKGVEKSKSGKFRARIYINGKKKHLGTFDNLEDAGKIYQNACNKQIEKELIMT